jgi:hypothetical protein
MKIQNITTKHPSLTSRPINTYKRILSLFLLLTLIGSSFGGLVYAEETVTSVKITTTSSTIPIQLYAEGDTVELTALAIISGGSTSQIDVTELATWTSSSSLIKVTKGVLSATGSVSSATITAKYKTYTDTIIVKADYSYDELKLKTADGSTDSSATQNVDLGIVLSFTAFADDENVTTTGTWSSSSATVATVAEGKVTLLTAGTTTITVKYKGRTDSIVLTVASPFESLMIQDAADKEVKEAIERNVGDVNVVLKAVPVIKTGSAPDLYTTKNAVWTTSNSSVVKVAEGDVTIVGQGTATVTAKRFGVSDTVTFIVRTPFEALKVTPDKAIQVTLYGARVELSASVSKGTKTAEIITKDADWKVADPAIAAIEIDTTTSPTKVFVKPKGVGTTKVTVSYLGLTKEITITVYPSITSVDITKERLDVFTGDTADLPAITGVTSAGDSKDVTKLAKWKSANEAVVAIVDGKWKAIKTGTATLTAEVENEPNSTTSKKSDTIIVEVHNKVLALIPETDTISVVIGKEVSLPAVRMIYEDGEEEVVTDKVVWKSSTANLLVKTDKMKGLLPANATLTGTYLDKTIKIKVIVEEEFTSFLITPNKLSMTLKKSQTIKVVGTTKSGKKVTLSSRLDWTASNPEHVTIKGSSVKSVAEGSGKLTASIQGKPLEIPYVITAKLTKLTASETSFKPAIGAKVDVALSALYENGQTSTVTTQAVWTTSKASVATVSDGKITIVSKGSATIKAAFGGKTVTVRITVK